MSTYLFNIKREDARRALEALYLQEDTDPRLLLGELRALRFDLEEYIRSVEGEISGRNGRLDDADRSGTPGTRKAGDAVTGP